MLQTYDCGVAVIQTSGRSPPSHTHTPTFAMYAICKLEKALTGGTVDVQKFYTLRILHNNTLAYILQKVHSPLLSLHSADLIPEVFQPIFYRLCVLR
jgi:hypothetical protein